METITSKLQPIPLRMTNFDHSIDEGFEEALRAGGVYGQRSAWNFCGYVWFVDGTFHEEVWQYHALMGTRSATTLQELMKIVNDDFGAD